MPLFTYVDDETTYYKSHLSDFHISNLFKFVNYNDSHKYLDLNIDNKTIIPDINNNLSVNIDYETITNKVPGSSLAADKILCVNIDNKSLIYKKYNNTGDIIVNIDNKSLILNDTISVNIDNNTIKSNTTNNQLYCDPSTLIDKNTIKTNSNNQLYVDTSVLPQASFILPGSITAYARNSRYRKIGKTRIFNL